MGGLTSLAWRSLAARRGRTALSIIGIALGVGVLFASLATDAGIDASIDRTVRDLVGRADLRVAAFGDPGLSAESVAAIERGAGRRRRGARARAPDLPRRRPRRSERPAEAGHDPRGRSGARGEGPSAAARRRRRPPGPEAFTVLVTERLAAEDALAVGSDLTFQAGAEGPVSLEVVGIVEGDGPFVGSSGRTVIVPLRTAQRLLGDDGVSRVDIVVGEGATPLEVTEALEVALTTEPYVLSSPGELAASLRVSTADFRSTTALIAAVALFVGAFLIFNTLSMTVTERVRELGLLRAAGATRRQVGRFVIVQALILGIVGSIVGLVVGIALAELMALYVRSIGSIPFERVGMPVASAVIAIVIGLFVTLAASLEPARRAGSISPVEALKARLDPAAAQRARLRWLVGVFVAVGVAGLLVWPRDAGLGGLAARRCRVRVAARGRARLARISSGRSRGSPACRSRASSGSRSDSPAPHSPVTGAERRSRSGR